MALAAITLPSMQRTSNLVAVPALVLAMALLAGAARPHDTWVLTIPGDGEQATMRLSVRTGMDFPTSENSVAAENLSGWLVLPNGTKRPLGPFEARAAQKDSSCHLGELGEGVHVAVVDTKPRHIDMVAKKFNDYLLHDGLPHVLASRLDADELDRDATEQYRKCAKVVFAVGTGSAGNFDKPVGQQLEIVPLDAPTLLHPRDTLRVRVLFAGRALERANLCWDLPGNGEDLAGCTWTDSAGEALVPIAREGWMTLRLVHMTRPQTTAHEWESFWASCSFEVRGQ